MMTLWKKFGNVRGHPSRQPLCTVCQSQLTYCCFKITRTSKQIIKHLWITTNPQFRNLKSGQGETYPWEGWWLGTRDSWAWDWPKKASAEVDIVHKYWHITLHSFQHVSRFTCIPSDPTGDDLADDVWLVVISHRRLSKATHTDRHMEEESNLSCMPAGPHHQFAESFLKRCSNCRILNQTRINANESTNLRGLELLGPYYYLSVRRQLRASRRASESEYILLLLWRPCILLDQLGG